MKKYKLYRQIVSVTLAGIMSVTALSSCARNKNKSEETTTTEVVTIIGPTMVEQDKYANEKEMVNSTVDNFKEVFPTLNDDVIKNTTLIFLLNQIAKEDENGKINADVISNFKSIIDSDNMMDDLSDFLDVLEGEMIQSGKIVDLSDCLPKELTDESVILSNIINITNKIMTSDDSKVIVSEFDKIYTLFVKEDKITENGVEFKVRDLSLGLRALAQGYARTAAYYARNYIEEDKYKKLDERTDDQNNKAQIKTKLEILRNLVDEVSEVDIVEKSKSMDKKLTQFLAGKINVSNKTESNLVNYLNLKYLASDKVSTKDKREILEGYDDEQVDDVILLIDSITSYNDKNKDKMLWLSDLLIDSYKETENGMVDSIALDFVQFNAAKLTETVKSDNTYKQVFDNPYFQNLYKYFTKQDFVHKYKDENGKIVEESVMWQEISEGVNFVNNDVILYTLHNLPIEIDSTYIDYVQQNLSDGNQYIKNIIDGECGKANDPTEFVKTK